MSNELKKHKKSDTVFEHSEKLRGERADCTIHEYHVGRLDYDGCIQRHILSRYGVEFDFSR